jgi:hypothetical protein
MNLNGSSSMIVWVLLEGRKKKTRCSESNIGWSWYLIPLGNHPLPQVVMRSLDQVSWLPRFLLTRLPMGSPQWHCERSYSVQLREQRPNGTSLFQRGCVQKQTSRHPYTKDHASCQDLLPKSTEGEARTRVGIATSPCLEAVRFTCSKALSCGLWIWT